MPSMGGSGSGVGEGASGPGGNDGGGGGGGGGVSSADRAGNIGGRNDGPQEGGGTSVGMGGGHSTTGKGDGPQEHIGGTSQAERAASKSTGDFGDTALEPGFTPSYTPEYFNPLTEIIKEPNLTDKIMNSPDVIGWAEINRRELTTTEKIEGFIEDNASTIKGVVGGSIIGSIFGLFSDNVDTPGFMPEPVTNTFNAINEPFEKVDNAIENAIGKTATQAVDVASWGVAGFVSFGPIGGVVGLALGALAQSDEPKGQSFSVAGTGELTDTGISQAEIPTEKAGGIWPPVGLSG